MGKVNANMKSMQKGFSIVELMVSILIGLIILAGVVQVVLTSRSSFMGQEEMSFIQENARYAVSVIGKDIQNAGHWGCAGPGATSAMVGGVDDNTATFMTFSAVEGYEGGVAVGQVPGAFKDKVRKAEDTSASPADIKPDSIILKGLQGRTFTVKSHLDGVLTLNSADHPFDAGDYVGVVDGDCTRFGVFRAGGKSGEEVTYGSGGNLSQSIKPSVDHSIQCITKVGGKDKVSNACTGQPSNPQLYTNTATVMPYQAKAFYIGDSSVFNADVPALKRAVLRGGDVVHEEIALGVENMQILYGEAVAGNSIRYRTANLVEDWDAVVSVQIDLLFRSQTPMLPTAQEQLGLLGNDYEDRFARQVVSSTFRLRNRSRP